jgi:DNA-binding Xre family transcriptional regulator
MTLLRLGALLRDRRGGRGVREVAKEIGISPATLTRVEGGRLPDLATFQKICSWLKVNPNELLDVRIDNSDTGLEGESSTPVAAVHLKASKTLPPEAAKDLAQLIVIAHDELARRSRGRRTDVSSWL